MVFDMAASQAARDAGMEQAKAPQWWKDMAQRAIYLTASTKHLLVVDDVWANMPPVEAYPGPGPSSLRAMGAQMTAAARSGLIRRTDRVYRTSRVSAHRTPVTVWESLIRE